MTTGCRISTPIIHTFLSGLNVMNVFCCCGNVTRVFHTCFFSMLSMGNLSFCCFRIAHGSHSGSKLIKITDWNFPHRLKSVYVKDREFNKDITIERNNWKKYIHIDRETGSNEIFAMLDKIESETEVDIENLSKIPTRNT